MACASLPPGERRCGPHMEDVNVNTHSQCKGMREACNKKKNVQMRGGEKKGGESEHRDNWATKSEREEKREAVRKLRKRV